MDILLGALFIMVLRIIDVTIGTMRTILVIQAKKHYAATAGFVEVLVWITAMKYIVDHLDNNNNLFAYAIGFTLGNLLGITLEERIGFGYVQINIISKEFSSSIVSQLRKSKHGVTILPAEGGSGGVSVVIAIIWRRDQIKVLKIIDTVYPDSFITVQHSRPYRGFIHGSRK